MNLFKNLKTALDAEMDVTSDTKNTTYPRKSRNAIWTTTVPTEIGPVEFDGPAVPFRRAQALVQRRRVLFMRPMRTAVHQQVWETATVPRIRGSE